MHTPRSPDMTTLNFRDQKLTDAELDTELQILETYMWVEELELSGNRLTYVPDLTRYIQFRHLKRLNLSQNNIKTLTVGHIPPTCEILWSNGNQISDVPDMRPLTRLDRLDLLSNKIEHLPPSHLPSSLTSLRIAYSRLTDIGDLSHLTKLSALFLVDNPITTIAGLPNSLIILNAKGVRVRVLGEKCFGEKTYQLLKEKLNTGALIEPPLRVFHTGLSDVKNYFEQQQQAG